jgi:hypothetical protein
MRSFSRVSLAAAASAVLVGSLALPATAADNTTTTTTVVIDSGSIAVSAPGAASLSALTPGGTAGANINGVQVSDNRAGTEGWAVSVVLSDFTGNLTTDVIPAANASYTPSNAAVSGNALIGKATAADLSVPTTVQSATNVNGNNTATWDALVQVTAPSDALADTYTATLTHSVL